jgi:hypothetical protein
MLYHGKRSLENKRKLIKIHLMTCYGFAIRHKRELKILEFKE